MLFAIQILRSLPSCNRPTPQSYKHLLVAINGMGLGTHHHLVGDMVSTCFNPTPKHWPMQDHQSRGEEKESWYTVKCHHIFTNANAVDCRHCRRNESRWLNAPTCCIFGTNISLGLPVAWSPNGVLGNLGISILWTEVLFDLRGVALAVIKTKTL